eukprot:CAMPEP_0178948134 /NCGR_PEP_ID=MMETSP0789-20121207/5302_1 /TAXON_ID=3005 /ORGANISM="Rhizosolenia setigera, Strain CCMP 1694" /LENGTH=393 /DNA_ID=CAMNT_0020628463 /DNA_START=225 /DNA_END=1407 /DNA_ORIENTATION=+
MKRLEIPALILSTVSNVASRVLRLKPMEIPNDSVHNNHSNNNNKPRIAVVTGSNTGVGYETAKSLVHNHGFEVIIACRSKEKGIQACQEINNSMEMSTTTTMKREAGKAVFLRELDLADLDSVRKFGDTMNQHYSCIDVLVNNAGCNSKGVVYNTKDSSSSSLDILFLTNFLGHFLLTNLLLDKCKRIVNLSSVTHHFPNIFVSKNKNSSPVAVAAEGDINSVEFWKEKATFATLSENSKKKTYGASKLAAILFTLELQRRYGESKGIRSIAVNPGSVNSDIWRNYSNTQKKLFRLLYLSPQQGSQTSIAASVLQFEDDVVYLQPYRLPPIYNNNKKKKKRKSVPPYPVFEMLGPFMGYRETQPRLPEDDGVLASQSLFQVCEDLAGCKFPLE